MAAPQITTIKRLQCNSNLPNPLNLRNQQRFQVITDRGITVPGDLRYCRSLRPPGLIDFPVLATAIIFIFTLRACLYCADPANVQVVIALQVKHQLFSFWQHARHVYGHVENLGLDRSQERTLY